MVRRTIILMLTLVFCMGGFSAWADDDAIIDIDNHIASFSGTWGTNNTPILFYGDDFRWAACSGSSSITAEAVFSSVNVRSNSTAIYADITGEYAVYVRWVVHPNRTTNAKYRIYDGATYLASCVTTMNQQIRGGEWIYCNTVNLTAGNTAVVKLGNDCETGKYVVADAVRFVRVSKDAVDIVDEPGIDWSISAGGLIDLATSPIEIRSSSITCPRAGRVLATAAGSDQLYATASGNWCRNSYSLSETGSWDSQRSAFASNYLPTTQVAERSIILHDVATCNAGDTITYRFYGERSSDPCRGRIWAPSLVLQFFTSIY